MGEWFLSESFKSDKRVDPDGPIGNSYYITHDCPFCGDKASAYRALPWIMSSCASSGSAVFPCDNCGESLTFPSDVFSGGLIESLLTPDGSGVKSWSNSSNNELGKRTPNEVFVPNWIEIFFSTNSISSGVKSYRL